MIDKEAEILSNYQLMDLTKKLKLKVNIICKDELINCNNDYLLYIINLSNTGTKGTHWITLTINNNKAYYYDSFGRKPIKEIKYFCKIHKLKLKYNKFIHQDINDNSCGWYCLFHILTLIYNKFNFNKTLELLNNNDNNNKTIELFFDKLFKI
jgi:hypothetical protein